MQKVFLADLPGKQIQKSYADLSDVSILKNSILVNIRPARAL